MTSGAITSSNARSAVRLLSVPHASLLEPLNCSSARLLTGTRRIAAGALADADRRRVILDDDASAPPSVPGREPHGRIVPLILATAALLLAMAAPAFASHSIAITYTGPAKAGSELILSCPEGFTLGSGEADFYRDPKMRAPVALNVSGHPFQPAASDLGAAATRSFR